MQCFERALLGTPKQCRSQSPISSGLTRDEGLFFGGEIVRYEGVAARLNHFQITAELDGRVTDGAKGSAASVAQGNRNPRRRALPRNFGRA